MSWGRDGLFSVTEDQRLFPDFIIELQVLSFQSLVDVSAVPNLDYPDGQFVVLNGIHDTIYTLPDTVEFLSGQLFAARWSGVNSEGLNSTDDPLQGSCGKSVKFFGC